MLWAPGRSPSLYAGRQARHTVCHIEDTRDQDRIRAVNMSPNQKVYDVGWRTLVMSFEELCAVRPCPAKRMKFIHDLCLALTCSRQVIPDILGPP
jgi:hypothetical protein